MKKSILTAVLVIVALSVSAFNLVLAGGPNCTENEVSSGTWLETNYTVTGKVGLNGYTLGTDCEVKYPTGLVAYKPRVDVETDVWYNNNVLVPSSGAIVAYVAVVTTWPDTGEWELVDVEPGFGKTPRLPEDHRIVNGRWRLDSVYATELAFDGGYAGSVKLWIDNQSGDTFVILPDGVIASIRLIEPGLGVP